MQFQPDAIDSKRELMEMMGVTSTPQTPVTEIQNSENAFSDSSAAFWVLKGKDLSNAYEKGCMISNTSAVAKYEYENFLLSLIKVVEEITREELIKKGYTLDEIKNIIKIFEETVKILAFNLNNKTKPQEISVKSLVACLHGFINNYAEKVK